VYSQKVSAEMLGASKHTAGNVCETALQMGDHGQKIQTVKYPEVIDFRGVHAMSDSFLKPIGHDPDVIEIRADPEGESPVERSSSMCR
jgi:hypothetical protein